MYLSDAYGLSSAFHGVDAEQTLSTLGYQCQNCGYWKPYDPPAKPLIVSKISQPPKSDATAAQIIKPTHELNNSNAAIVEDNIRWMNDNYEKIKEMIGLGVSWNRVSVNLGERKNCQTPRTLRYYYYMALDERSSQQEAA